MASEPTPSGDRGDLTRLFEEQAIPHSDAMYRTALRMTRNAGDAEDLVQEAMLKAFRFYHRFEQGTNIRAWLFKIMTNLYINRYRKQTRAPQELSIDNMEDFALFRQMTDDGSYDPSRPDDHVFGELFADKVKEEIDRLPDEFRTVAVLSILEGFSYQEIAEIAGLQLGTVKFAPVPGAQAAAEPSGRLRTKGGLYQTRRGIMISCQETLRRFFDYLNRELSEISASEVEAHLAECRKCYDRMEFEKRFNGFVATELDRESRSELRANLLERIRAMEQAASPEEELFPNHHDESPVDAVPLPAPFGPGGDGDTGFSVRKIPIWSYVLVAAALVLAALPAIPPAQGDRAAHRTGASGRHTFGFCSRRSQ